MPAHAVLKGNHMTCLTLLLRHGADLEKKNHNQQTLLQCITKKYVQERTEALLKETGKTLYYMHSNFLLREVNSMALNERSMGD